MRAALLLLTAIASAPLLRAGDWPQFLGPTRNGISSERLGAPWSKDGPKLLWQRPVGEGFSTPVVAQGQLILFHRVGDRETIEALDATTGKALWKADYPTSYHDDFSRGDGPRASPAIAGDRVYTYGADGQLYCWSLSNGAQRWHVDTETEFKPARGFFGRVCSPLVESNAVILNIGGRPQAGIVAFQADTGKVLWKATSDEASYSSPTMIDRGGQRRLLVVTRSTLTALDPAQGHVLFQYPWQPPVHASVSAAVPLLVGDLIFLSASYGLGATVLRWDAKSPEKVWASDDVLSNHYATSVAYRDFLYGFHGRQEQGCELRCVELKSGKVRWSESGLKAGTVTLAGDQLLVLTERGELIRAQAAPDGFKPVARAQVLPFDVRAHPALADGLLYARNKDKLVCVDLR
jgi:outer membrane protein assembly factor BamB